jgi:hypothetical protein
LAQLLGQVGGFLTLPAAWQGALLHRRGGVEVAYVHAFAVPSLAFMTASQAVASARLVTPAHSSRSAASELTVPKAVSTQLEASPATHVPAPEPVQHPNGVLSPVHCTFALASCPPPLYDWHWSTLLSLISSQVAAVPGSSIVVATPLAFSPRVASRTPSYSVP